MLPKLRESNKLNADLKFWRSSIKLLNQEEAQIANKLVQTVIDTCEKLDTLHVEGAGGITAPSLAKDLRDELVDARIKVKEFLNSKLRARKRLKLR